MRHWPAAAVRVGLVLMIGATLVRSGPADAQTDTPAPTALGAFEGSGQASGVRAVYNPEGILPIPPPVDLSAPDALATIASGPSTFARASVADPGDLLANPDALLVQASPSYPAGAIPAYPFRISAANGSGSPSTRLTPAPGLEASVTAQDDGSEAEASTPRATAPAIVTLGSARSHASTHTHGSTVTVTASSSLSDFNLLGMVAIKSVSTDLTVISDGTSTKTTGGTVIAGASLLGQPLTIDADGIHARSGASSAESATVKAINDLLASLGVRVTVASPIDQQSAEAGQVISAGLRIDLEVSNRTFPQIGALLDKLPPLPTLIPGAPGLDDVLALARARHLLTVAVGQAQVTLGVRSDPAGKLDTPTDGSVAPSTELPLGGSLAIDPVTVPTIASGGPTKPIGAVASGVEPPLGFAGGIGVAAILGLLLQPLLADRISRGAVSLLAGDATDSCPREGT